MKPLRLRMTILTFLLMLIGCGATAYGLKTFLEIFELNQRVRQSILLRDWVEALPSQSVRDDLIKDLQAYRAELTPIERQNALSDVIQAYSANNKPLLRKRIETFNSIEKKWVVQQEPIIHNKELQTIYFGALLIAVMFFGLIYYRGFFVKNVFDYLEMTSQKMIDFLNGKFSYQFEIPPQNEVGDLQSTFNAMAQRVLQNMEELKALDSAKSEFLNIASHELRTPMTSIKGSLGLISSGVMGELPKDALQLVQIAETETDRLIRLINDILDMAKIEAGKLPLKLSWHSAHDLLEKVRVSLIGLAETAQIKIEVFESHKCDLYIDKDRIQQVIMNLASNAIKFSPKDSVVELGLEIDGPQLRLYVTDQGKGISPEDQKRIFEKFRQATGPDTPLVKGTGLGLAIAKALVEEHNGGIGVHSQPGKGSTFYFTLPNWRFTQVNTEVEQDKITGEAA